jgi:hypothetical protein
MNECAVSQTAIRLPVVTKTASLACRCLGHTLALCFYVTSSFHRAAASGIVRYASHASRVEAMNGAQHTVNTVPGHGGPTGIEPYHAVCLCLFKRHVVIDGLKREPQLTALFARLDRGRQVDSAQRWIIWLGSTCRIYRVVLICFRVLSMVSLQT